MINERASAGELADSDEGPSHASALEEVLHDIERHLCGNKAKGVSGGCAASGKQPSKRAHAAILGISQTTADSAKTAGPAKPATRPAAQSGSCAREK